MARAFAEEHFVLKGLTVQLDVHAPGGARRVKRQEEKGSGPGGPEVQFSRQPDANGLAENACAKRTEVTVTGISDTAWTRLRRRRTTLMPQQQTRCEGCRVGRSQLARAGNHAIGG